MNALGIKLLIGAFLMVAAVFTWNAYTDSLVATGDKAGYQRAQREYKDAELKAVQAVRAEEGRRIAALQGVIVESHKDLAAARAAGAAAVTAGERLRVQLAAVRRVGAAASSGTPAGGPPADTSGDLLAHVQRRLDEAADGVARFGDEGHIAGRACERAYQALTP